ncbi:outer membrane lipoprotein carrier protein LolA [Paenibacillus sp. H1-7]|uniref:outer membrane lipoprotein carrier protein LolA n=1 Tax=Paenibacillus sp. H1-7 TaxID=2282849 RepID=UPI001EF79588|nr:outer membrane lipoprotein carrier protein LolA [Paenibacillus sp. H1-7]ULL19022.1 outer membrane lipoprotein carrier protein LolA [Paenibacillus sp. H1-7]
MRRFTWVIALVLSFSLVLAGCGKKDSGSVVKDLDGVINKLQSYQGSGRMVLHTGQEPQEYQVEVWYQNPHYYRISLTNAKKDITQIVLRNDDGVFVLTPHLNKSFRFQSDWPENQGQVYLYQSLVQSILMDNDRQFTTDENAYVFDVLANYQNGSLARQKIWLDKKNYAPQHVEVSDTNANVMVIVDFNQFEFGKKFDKDSFDMQRNMTSWKMSQPTMGQPGAASSGAQSNAANSGAAGTGSDKAAGAANSATSGATTNGTAANGTSATGTSGAAGSKSGAAATGSNAGAATDAGKATTPAAGTNGAGASTGSSANGTGAKAGAGATSGAAGATGAANGATRANAAAGANGASGTAGTNAAAGTAAGTKADASKQQASFGVIEPNYLPSGVKKLDMSEIKLGEEKAIMLRYSGKYNYTLIESRPVTQTVSVLPGDIVDLGYTLAVVTGDEKKTLTWTYDGIEFRLSTADLPQTEMIKVAQAVQDEIGK